ncbi:MAG: hypothetical protein M1827_006235 [Pycnora praestabilis]|nr:MAG: hypothetical protein M1827_006235 [Pycnora praestabilis]
MSFLNRMNILKKKGKGDSHHAQPEISEPTTAFRTRPSSTRTVRNTFGGQFGIQDASFDDMRISLMGNSLINDQKERIWTMGSWGEGVFVKRADGSYFTSLDPIHGDPDGLVMAAIRKLDFAAVMTINTRPIQTVVRQLIETEVPWESFPLGNLHLQIIESFANMGMVKRQHFGALIKDPGYLLVWDTDPAAIIARGADLERRLFETIWSQPEKTGISEYGSTEKILPVVHIDEIHEDLEGRVIVQERRPRMMYNSLMVALTFALMGAALGSLWQRLAIELKTDGGYTRLAVVAYAPVQIFLGLFFMQLAIFCLMQLFGPISQISANSTFYSGKPTRRLQPNVDTLPHVTIQMPVYTEGLSSVIGPTVQSLKAAVRTYEMQGGTANIFINDDGMMLLGDEYAQRRINFYKTHDIGWVARPRHNSSPQAGEKPFLRRGKFKKASNMNYGLMISDTIEQKLSLIERKPSWTQDNERVAYKQCLRDVLKDQTCHAWADGDIRIGDYILLIDSDTRIPEDCLLDAVSEMELSPRVAILQFSSSILQVAHNYFENGVAYFTNLVYTAITFMVANGDMAPFVGHNALLRWSSLQQVSYEDEDQYIKYWSENRVSEDFDMSLRLQSYGYTVRMATYTGPEFKEGVSLTVYDEVARWEKYAYGACELMFNPLRYWFTKGPFDAVFRAFITSNIRLSSKATIIAYFGTYFAIGAAWILVLVNYFIIGWFNGHIDHWYLDSYRIYFSLLVIFSVLSTISLAVLRYRTGEKPLWGSCK